MKLRSLILATIVLLALVGTLYWSEHRKPAADTANAAESPAILKLDQASITKVEVRNKDAEPIVLARSSSGTWQITEPKPYAADQNNVSSALSSLSSLNSERVIEERASDLRPYGLAPPAAEVDVTEKDNKSQKLLLGDETPAGSAVYAMLAGDPRVFTIASFNKSSIDKNLNDFRDKRLLELSSDQVSRVEITEKDQTLEFGRNKNEWQILQPRPLRAANTEVDQLVRKLTDAKMDLTGSDSTSKEANSAYSSGTAVATAKLTAPSGTQELQVKKSKDTYYAKSSAVEGVYKIDSDLAQALEKNIDAYRNKKIFDFSFNDPNKIEVHTGSKAIYLTRNGNDWWGPDGKKMDEDSVQSLVSNLRFIGADKFVDSGFGTPTLEATVTYDDGKHTEKVSLSKTTDGYIAKREGESAMYHVQSASAEAVQAAADGIKLAPGK